MKHRGTAMLTPEMKSILTEDVQQHASRPVVLDEPRGLVKVLYEAYKLATIPSQKRILHVLMSCNVLCTTWCGAIPNKVRVITTAIAEKLANGKEGEAYRLSEKLEEIMRELGNISTKLDNISAFI
jgi:hypothetical protein